jgi:endonuclease YncB( thermonuclease family)
MVLAAAGLLCGTAVLAEEIYTPLGPVTTKIGAAEVVDGDTLRIDDVNVRLHGIDAPELSQTCGDKPCGRMSRDWLAARVERRMLECLGNARDQHDRFVALCRVDGQNLNRETVAAGWAVAYTKYTDVYVTDEEAAREARQGLWSMAFERPSEHRAARRRAGPSVTPPNAECGIKGLVEAGGALVYRSSDWEGYAGRAVDEGLGERWFCSPADAEAAGWRKAA